MSEDILSVFAKLSPGQSSGKMHLMCFHKSEIAELASLFTRPRASKIERKLKYWFSKT